MRALRVLLAHVVGIGDPVLVALLGGTALIEALASSEPPLDAAFATAVALPLLVRRRAPLAALVLVIAASYAAYAWGPDSTGVLQTWIALNVAIYSVAAHCPLRRAVAGVAIAAAFVLA